MVTTPKAAKTKYKNKIKNAIKKDKYKKGVAKFLGVEETEISSAVVDSWKDAVKDVDALADLWFENYKAAMTGGKE